MKKFVKYTFILMLLLATACSDFLEEENKSNIVADEFYTTASGYEALVNATYSTLRNIYGELPYVFTLGTDLYTSGRGTPPSVGLLNYRDLDATESNVLNLYKGLYEGIQLANTAIYFNGITEQVETLSVREGEVRFLRAYFYFLLVQSFGNVPLVKERVSSVILGFERAPAANVYNFIIEEMEAAMDLVPEKQDDNGRVNKRVIRHYLAKVYLTRGYQSYGESKDFETAAKYADAAIAGQGLNLTFENLFYPGNEDNEEIIFAVQYDKSSILVPSEDGNTQNYWFGPYMGGEGTKFGYPNRAYGLVPSLYAFDVFSEKGMYDSRWEATFMTAMYETDPAIPGAGDNMAGYYRYYTEADNRDNIPIKFFYAHKWVDPVAWRAANPATRANTKIRPFEEPVGGDPNWRSWEASEDTNLDNATPAVKKFDDPTSEFSNKGSSTRDIFLARLGETYLIAGEAYYKAGNSGMAADRINVVRKRAAKPGAESQMEITAADIDIDFILDERARELLGEYHRWFDLKRTGTLAARNLQYNTVLKKLGVNPFGDGTLKTLRPIPQTVINLNEAIGPENQNPGY